MKIKEKFKLAAVLSGLLLNSASFAGLVVIDDFSTPQGPVFDRTVDGVGVTNTIPGVRSITHDLTAATMPSTGQTEVLMGWLDVSNRSMEDSQVTVSWLLNPGIFPSSVTDLKYYFQVIRSDLNPVNVKFAMDGQNLANFDVPGGLSNTPGSFAVAASTLETINQGGILQMTMNGLEGWDFTIDTFGFNYTTPMPAIKPLPAPEPTPLAILSLALMGAGYVQRKKNL